MKRNYMKPSIEVEDTSLVEMICGSKDITSDKGIDYGGVDEEGTKVPDSRYKGEWDDDDDE